MKEWAYRRFFVLSWGWGVLAAHLFLTSESSIFPRQISILVLLGFTLALFLAGFFVKGVTNLPLQLILPILGTVAGYLLWPQQPVVP